jgi:hypothetical protein
MIYSYPGAGKTTLASQFPRPLFLETDVDGASVILNLPVERQEKIGVYETQNWNKLVTFLKALSRDKDQLAQYDTLVLDTLSTLQDMERGVQVGEIDLTDDKWMFNEAIYARNNFKCDKLVEMIIGMGKNVILNCHLSEDIIQISKTTSKKHLRPGISPGLTRTVAADMEGIFYLDYNGVNRTLHFQGGTDILTKSRFKTRQTSMIDPTYDKLVPMFNTLVKQAP